jgi:4'-phosphopantetheinyl transferase EntD
MTRSAPGSRAHPPASTGKESVYKAWFPLARRWLGFEEARVAVDPDAGTFRARLLIEPPAGVPVEFNGRYLIKDGLVLTAIVVQRWRDQT